MVVFRITTAKWAGKLTASGFPARWNSKGTHILYTASTRALACLENLVHRSGEGLNGLFKITEISTPEEASLKTIDREKLPENWFKMDMYSYCQRIGDQWTEEKRTLLLKVPSSIIREEFNILLNPYHPEFQNVEIQAVTPFRFDDRL